MKIARKYKNNREKLKEETWRKGDAVNKYKWICRKAEIIK
jgi:hypothetical protein